MTKKQKRQQEVAKAFRYTGDKEQADKLHEREGIYVFNFESEFPKDTEIYKLLFRKIWDDNVGGWTDLSYEICAKACELIADSDIKDLEGEDLFYESESASVYTSDRLGYLNNNNQGEISDKMKEYDSDIQTACAVWYDDMVRNVALELRDYIMQ